MRALFKHGCRVNTNNNNFLMQADELEEKKRDYVGVILCVITREREKAIIFKCENFFVIHVTSTDRSTI